VQLSLTKAQASGNKLWNSRFSKGTETLRLPIASPALCLKFLVVSRYLLESKYMLKNHYNKTVRLWDQPGGFGMEMPVWTKLHKL